MCPGILYDQQFWSYTCWHITVLKESKLTFFHLHLHNNLACILISLSKHYLYSLVYFQTERLHFRPNCQTAEPPSDCYQLLQIHRQTAKMWRSSCCCCQTARLWFGWLCCQNYLAGQIIHHLNSKLKLLINYWDIFFYKNKIVDFVYKSKTDKVNTDPFWRCDPQFSNSLNVHIRLLQKCFASKLSIYAWYKVNTI